MFHRLFTICGFICISLVSSCSVFQSSTPPTQPDSIHATASTPPPTPAPKTHSMGIIGAVEPVYFLPMKSPLFARIDTGAESSALDAQNIRPFEREGEKWVAFDIINRQNGAREHFEKRIYRQMTIKRIGQDEERISVLMTIKMGKERITAQFSLTDRSKFDYQALIGRNILTGRAIVDTSLAKTLY
ncbi:MAG: ATP-dependent zinc protease [Alphaproteobacteria bacterium]